jgi:hypothetical protein
MGAHVLSSADDREGDGGSEDVRRFRCLRRLGVHTEMWMPALRSLRESVCTNKNHERNLKTLYARAA